MNLKWLNLKSDKIKSSYENEKEKVMLKIF